MPIRAVDVSSERCTGRDGRGGPPGTAPPNRDRAASISASVSIVARPKMPIGGLDCPHTVRFKFDRAQSACDDR